MSEETSLVCIRAILTAFEGKKNGANDRIRQGGLQPDAVPERSEGNRLIVRIGYWRQPMSKAEIQNKNSGKTFFARCFWVVSEQFSRYLRAKKMEPMTGFEPVTYSLRVNCSTS